MAATGTNEWAKGKYNLQRGCEHGCLYCYAFAEALRFGRVKDYEEWKCPFIDLEKVGHRFQKRPYRIMFPTTHDITPKNINECEIVLRAMLKVGNEVLIVSKPHMECIQRLCDHFADYKNQITFRFTIGSVLDAVIRFWEPGAPCFGERFEALEHAYNCGFQTSVSCEPYLDASITEVVRQVTPFVTDAIWIGKMNQIEQRVDMTGWKDEEYAYLKMVKRAQTDLAVPRLADALRGNPKIKWKESIKKVLGIPLATEAGKDE